MKIGILMIANLLFFCSCTLVKTQTNNESNQTNIMIEEAENSDTVIFTEPIEFTGVKTNDKVPENMKKVWKEFIAGGQYRLAQPADMTFSETVKSKLPGQGKSPIIPYEYAWGDLNYEKRIQDAHLAAIVVDTKKNDSNKFGLVIFSPKRNTKAEYDVNWLFQNKDLSKTTVQIASGELYVTQYTDDGSRKACSVNWNKELENFECK
jgi:hypothetical protein